MAACSTVAVPRCCCHPLPRPHVRLAYADAHGRCAWSRCRSESRNNCGRRPLRHMIAFSASSRGEAAAPRKVGLDDDDLFFRMARVEDLNRIVALEEAGYPEDEAASPQKMDFRVRNAPGLFMCCVTRNDDMDEDVIVGYVCGTLTRAETLTHDSMSTHNPEGSTLCIHSVCVDEGFRRRGVALRSLIAYVDFVRETTPHVRWMRLICKEPLVPLYRKARFEVVGPSPVVHGSDPWIEMALRVRSREEEETLDRKRRSWYF